MTDPMRPTELTCDDVRELAGAFVLDALEPAEADAVRERCDRFVRDHGVREVVLGTHIARVGR